MEAAKLDDDSILTLPYGKFLEVLAGRPENDLINSAMIGVSAALGNHPQKLSDDQAYFTFVRSYVTEAIAGYVVRCAATQLSMLSLFGVNTAANTLKAFIPELEKVKSVVIVNEEAAEAILGDEDRTMNFLLAVSSMTALYCQKNKDMAKLFGLKRTLFGFGGLKYQT